MMGMAPRDTDEDDGESAGIGELVEEAAARVAAHENVSDETAEELIETVEATDFETPPGDLSREEAGGEVENGFRALSLLFSAMLEAAGVERRKGGDQ